MPGRTSAYTSLWWRRPAITAPSAAKNVSLVTPSQSAQSPHIRLSSTSVSPTSKTTRRTATALFGRRQPGALAAQFGDARLGVEVGPVAEREVGDPARVVWSIGDADLLAGNVDAAQPVTVLKDRDIGE